MTKVNLLVISFIVSCLSVFAQEKPVTTQSTPALIRTESAGVYDIAGKLTVRHAGRHQRYNAQDNVSYDKDIHSPKSVSISPDGSKYYVNSLEGYKTVVYDAHTHKKLATVKHSFDAGDSALWAPSSGLYEFHHKYEHPNTFSGKPVESTFTHSGRYLWVPYYRRSFDLNAQDPSAVAVIDTRSNDIVRLFETGPLPKMVAASPNGRWVAVTHWGENTVGIIDVSHDTPKDWHYIDNYIVDYRLKLDYSLTESVNRDVGSGYALRGTVFTPDSRYLLVGCMGGTGGIAVIDMTQRKYLGRVTGMKDNVRHLLIKDGWLYLSINQHGAVQRIRLQSFLAALPMMKNNKVTVVGWQTCKLAAGARTISISPDGRYIFAACNSGSCLSIVDTESFAMIGKVPVDSYPVGLDISDDGKMLIVTSQGRNERGGNAVNIFEIEYK